MTIELTRRQCLLALAAIAEKCRGRDARDYAQDHDAIKLDRKLRHALVADPRPDALELDASA